MDKDYIYQVPIREWIENDWGKEILVPVYGRKKDHNWDIFFQSYLIPITEADSQLETDTYDIHDSLLPGITVYGAWDSGEAIYHKWCNDIDVEPFVIKRNYYGLANDNIEIVEEFRLLFNLYYNSQTKEYTDLENEVVVVKVDNSDFVRVHKKYLKSYLAIKKMAIVIHIDSRCVKCDSDEDFPANGLDYRSNFGRSKTSLSKTPGGPRS